MKYFIIIFIDKLKKKKSYLKMQLKYILDFEWIKKDSNLTHLVSHTN